MWLCFFCTLLNAGTNAVAEVFGADVDGFDKQRRRVVFFVVERAQVDERALVGVAEQTFDERRNGVAVGLWECCLRLCHGSRAFMLATLPQYDWRRRRAELFDDCANEGRFCGT
jgi:hypothetical protein